MKATLCIQAASKRGRENIIPGTHGYSLQIPVFYTLQHLLVPQFFASLHHLSKQNLEKLLIEISE